MKPLVAVLVLTLVCLGSSPDVAVYPGSVVEEEVSKALRKSTSPDSVAYTTPDAFDKVDAFYRKAGSEDLPHTRNISADGKYVLLRFPGKKFQVQLSWAAADTIHATVIQFVKKP